MIAAAAAGCCTRGALALECGLLLLRTREGTSVLVAAAVHAPHDWPEHHFERRILLDVVVRQRAAVFQLLAGKDQALLVWRDAFLVLDLGLHILDTVARLDLERDGLARGGFEMVYTSIDHKDLHATAQAEHHWSVRCGWACKQSRETAIG